MTIFQLIDHRSGFRDIGHPVREKEVGKRKKSRNGLNTCKKLKRRKDAEEGIEGVFSVRVENLPVQDFRGSRSAVLQDDRFEIMAQGVHGRCEDAEMGGDAGYDAQGDSVLFQMPFQTGVKKSGKPGFRKPRVRFLFVQFIDDFCPFGFGKGMGFHLPFENEILFVEGIRGKDDGPTLLPKSPDRTVDRVDRLLCKRGDGEVFLGIKVVFDHVDD